MVRYQPLTAEQLCELELHLRRDDISAMVRSFAGRSISKGVRSARSQSYDHCFNYFADTPRLDSDLEKSCTVLGFYLASWGMYRGSTYLQQETNSSHLVGVVTAIQDLRPALAAVDLDGYGEEGIQTVLHGYSEIKKALHIEQRNQVTLVSKIMVAAFGCIPAFDRNFKAGLRKVLGSHARLPHGRIDAHVLQLVGAFYRANRVEIDHLHQESRSIAFGVDDVTSNRLSRAKIVDMYCYEIGAG